MQRGCAFIVCLVGLLCCGIAWGQSGQQAQALRVGILAFRAKAETLERWQPLADHLRASGITRPVVLHAYSYAELAKATHDHELDVVLTQPAQYIELSLREGLHSPLATLVEREGSLKLHEFGGVIVVRADRSDIQHLGDLRGKRIASPDPQSLGGALAQLAELRRMGLTAGQDFKVHTSGMPHDRAVEEVLAGDADAAFVRTGVIEQMAAEQRFAPGRLRVLRPAQVASYPLALSTALYPQWALAAMPWLDEEVARRVAGAVLSLPHGGEVAQALRIEGFTIPGNYKRVDELMRSLHVPPFDQIEPLSLADLWRQHAVAIASLGVALCAVLAVLSVMLARSRARIQRDHLRLEATSAALGHATREQRVILDSLGEAVLGVDSQGRCTFMNPAAVLMLGYVAEEVLGRDCRFLFRHPQRQGNDDDADQLVRATIADGRTRRARCDAWRKLGERFQVAVTVAPALQDEQVQGAVIVMTDMSEAERTRREVLQFQAIVQSSDDAIISQTLEGVVQSWNPGAERLFGYSAEEAVGQPFCSLFPPGCVNETTLLSECVRRGEHVPTYDTQRARRDGSVVEVSLTVSPVLDLDGRVVGLSQIVRDITARRQTQALTTARQAAEAANVAKSAFLANMSHEIRTPLNAILGMVHLLQRTRVTPQQQGYLATVASSGQHLLGMLNAILDLSKIEAGKFELDVAPVHLLQLATQVVDMLRDRAQAKGLHMHIECDATLGVLHGDALRLRQALLNYATNALKFTDRGGIIIRVNKLEDDERGTLVRLEVQDTGRGIEPGRLPELFNSFEQLDSSITREHGGSGLGLAITRRFAQLMGGEAGADSQVGQGSLFWFTARLKPATGALDAPGGALEPIDESAESLLRRYFSGRRILLVEDEPINREVAQALLAEVFTAVDVAADGHAAIEQVRQYRYDLILMDMQMPHLGGLDATRAIRQLPHGPDVPIVALTANAFSENRSQCLAAGMNDFTSKPVEPESLFACILTWLSRGHA